MNNILRKYMQKCNLSNQNQKKTLNKDKYIKGYHIKKNITFAPLYMAKG